jgi:hypothetical protein
MYAYVSFIVDVKKHHRCVPKDNEFRCLAFCNVHCLRKSSRIIVIPTTSINVLWDAIVPLGPTPTLIGSTICQTSKFIVFRNTSVVFLNINNKRHLRVKISEYNFSCSFSSQGFTFFLDSKKITCFFFL